MKDYHNIRMEKLVIGKNSEIGKWHITTAIHIQATNVKFRTIPDSRSIQQHLEGSEARFFFYMFPVWQDLSTPPQLMEHTHVLLQGRKHPNLQSL
jgi:hypothetical protein